MSDNNDIFIDLSNPDLYASKWHIKALNDTSRYLILYGSRGSGKSHVVAQKCVKELISPEYCCWLLLRKQSNTVLKSMYNLIKSIIIDWGLYEYFDFNKTDKTITCKLTGNTANGLGLDDPDKMKSFVNPTVAWGEEGDAISYDDFIKVNTSLRGSRNLQFILTFNPEDENSWINDEFFPAKKTYEKEDGKFVMVESKKPKTKIYHLNFEINRYCNKEEADTYRSLEFGKRRAYYLVFCLGLWGGKVEGLVFDDVVYHDGGWDKYPSVDERKKYGHGVDFGFTNDPSTLTECCIAHGEIHLRCHMYQTGLVNTVNENKLGQKSIEGELRKINFDKSNKIIADSAEPKSIADLNNSGFWVVRADKPAGSIKYGINLLQGYIINVYTKGAKDPLKYEFKHYSYPKKKDGGYAEKPNDRDNHCIDGVRYWALKNLGIKNEDEVLIKFF